MKMILRISPSRQKAWRMLEHIYGQGDYAPERNLTNRLGIGAFQLEAGYPMRDAKHDAALLLAKHHNKGKEARHLIFSAEEMPNATEAEYQHAIAGVVAAAVDFAKSEAPGHDYIIQAHLDRHHPHAHMALCASAGQRCIDWGPKDLVRFQGLEFLAPATQTRYQLEPGRGKGKRPAGVGRVAYDHAVAHDFHATKEHTTAERLDYERVFQAIASGELTVSRRNKAGQPLSVLIDGKPVRLSKIRKAAQASPGPDSSEAPNSAPGTAPAPGNTQRRARPRPQRRANSRVRTR